MAHYWSNFRCQQGCICLTHSFELEISLYCTVESIFPYFEPFRRDSIMSVRDGRTDAWTDKRSDILIAMPHLTMLHIQNYVTFYRSSCYNSCSASPASQPLVSACWRLMNAFYTVNHKKRDILFLTITLANLNRFL